MKTLAVVTIISLVSSSAVLADEYIGQLSKNPYAPNSTSNPFGAGSRFDANSVKNPFGQYGSRYSNKSATNPYATDAPKLYDSQGNYRGKLSSNPYDPDSVSNPFGRYGSRFSPDSINNRFGAGNPYSSDSPTNPFGQGLSIWGQTDEPANPRSDTYRAPHVPTPSVRAYPSVPTYPSLNPYSSPSNPYSTRPSNPYSQPVSPYQLRPLGSAYGTSGGDGVRTSPYSGFGVGN